MHLLKDLGLLALDLEAEAGADRREVRAEVGEGLRAAGDVDDHHHVEVVRADRLGDVEDVHAVLGEAGAGLGEDAYGILADDGDDCFVHGR